MNAGATGVEIVLSGKLSGERSRKERFVMGYLKKSGQPSITDVAKGYAAALPRLGMVCVTVKIMMKHADRFYIGEDPKKDEKKEEEKKEEKKEEAEKEEKKEIVEAIADEAKEVAEETLKEMRITLIGTQVYVFLFGFVESCNCLHLRGIYV